jgi:hypothetical protein
LVEKQLIACILAHTNNLGEAEEYAPVTAGAFLAKRIKYGLSTPPRNSYGGAKLTQQQMVDVCRQSEGAGAGGRHRRAAHTDVVKPDLCPDAKSKPAPARPHFPAEQRRLAGQV